jgi:thioester reductase-like protein
VILNPETTGPDESRDLFQMLMGVCFNIRAVPDLEIPLDMLTAPFVAKAIITLSQQKAIKNGQVFHLCHPESILLVDYMNQFNITEDIIEVLPFEEWRERCADYCRSSGKPLLLSIMPLLENASAHLIVPPVFDCKEAKKGLVTAGVSYPSIEEILSPFLEFAFLVNQFPTSK